MFARAGHLISSETRLAKETKTSANFWLTFLRLRTPLVVTWYSELMKTKARRLACQGWI